MRDGTNPLRSALVNPIAPIVICAITHLPQEGGYHARRMEVIMASLETMRANMGVNDHNVEIAVWDNGSCPNLKGWLINNYRPDYLIFSRNVGKSIARASLVNMLPDDRIIGVADDDMFYYPNWLEKQLEVLSVYPNVGTVSGWPVRTQFRFHNRATVAWGKKNAKVEHGRFISPKEDKDFCTSIGRDYEKHIGVFNPKTGLGSAHDEDIKLTYRGVETYAVGHHAQWIGKVGIIKQFVEYTAQAMADERPFERAVDEAGLLRLTTFERTSQHIGNQLDDELEELWHVYVTRVGVSFPESQPAI